MVAAKVPQQLRPIRSYSWQLNHGARFFDTPQKKTNQNPKDAWFFGNRSTKKLVILKKLKKNDDKPWWFQSGHSSKIPLLNYIFAHVFNAYRIPLNIFGDSVHPQSFWVE